jgi:hypothetical protein
MTLLIVLQDLLGWIVALIFAMVLWTVLYVVFAAWSLQYIYSDWQTIATLSWIASLGYALSCIIILCIAKHVSWSNSPMPTEPMPGTDAYGYGASQPPYHVNAHNDKTGGQPTYYQQQAPVRNGAADHFDPFKP